MRSCRRRIACARQRWARFGRLSLFWAFFVLETLGRRRLASITRYRSRLARRVRAEGLRHLPPMGSFVLAANHYSARRTLDVIAVTLAAANQARPDLANRYLLVSGRRERDSRELPPLGRLVRSVVSWTLQRWGRNLVRIPLGSSQASIASLREWRQCACRRPSLVLPEGRGRLSFGAVRPGSGRWLATFGVPILPVGVWWEDEQPKVRFGAPIVWAGRTELHDAQLGLAIANLLPRPCAPAWEEALRRWRTAHAD